MPIELGRRASSQMPVAENARVAVEDGPYFPGSRSIWDVHSGHRLAHWNVPVQRVLPKSSCPAEYLNSKVVCPYALSPDGTRVAEGGSGVLRMYSLHELD